jgi:CheY-like chemotaxis protein
MKRPNILLVDDNRLFLEMEKEFLQPFAVMIYTARTGQEALDVVRMVRPDLIFMDLYMSGMDGAQCCAAIKGDPDLRSVPVIMIITASSGEDLERCRRAGCDQIITKPVDRRKFIDAGHKFLPLFDQIETRVPCLTLVVFRLGQETFHGTSANLSSQGIFIAFSGQVVPDDLVRLNFLVPDSGGEVVEATGRIAWINADTPLRKPALPRGFGVEFSQINPEGNRAIAGFIARAIKEGTEPVVEGAYMGETLF